MKKLLTALLFAVISAASFAQTTIAPGGGIFNSSGALVGWVNRATGAQELLGSNVAVTGGTISGATLGANNVTGTLGFSGSNGYMLKGNVGAGVGSQAPVFTIGAIANFAGVNTGAPAGQEDNTVSAIGWNLAAGNGRLDTAKPASGIVFENNYRQSSTQAFETHITMTDTSGVEHRGFTWFAPRDGGLGSSLAMQSDAFNLQKYDGTARISMNWVAGTMQVYGGAFWQHETNNAKFAQQLNAASSGYNVIPYYDNTDRYLMGPFQARGAVIQTGSYAGQWAHLEATSTPVNNDILLNGTFSAANGSADLKPFHFQSASASLTGTIYNSFGSAGLELTTSGATADAFVRYGVNGVSGWATGLDNSDGDKFKFSWSGSSTPAVLGTGDKMTLDSSGNLTIAGLFAQPLTTPASASATCTAGQIAHDASFAYHCVATDTWKRVAIATW